MVADWEGAAISYSNLSELEVTLGRLPDALIDARQAITHADQSGDAFLRMTTRSMAADALHQSGQRAEAGALFAEAEGMQQEDQPEFDLLYSQRGFRYCDWLLAPAEQAAWQRWLDHPLSNSKSQLSAGLAEIGRRGNKMFYWRSPGDPLLDIALDHLTLARVGLIRAILEGYPIHPQPTLDLPHVAAAVNGLHDAGQVQILPLGLLTAALYHSVHGEPDLAKKHLAEAQQIAERGPMPLFLADVHLTRARLFRDREALTQAAILIRALGYGRRNEELATAERALASSVTGIDVKLVRTEELATAEKALALPVVSLDVKLVSAVETVSWLPPGLRAIAVSQAADVRFEIPWDDDEERLATLVSEGVPPRVVVGLLDPGFALLESPEVAVIAIFPSGATQTVGTAKLAAGPSLELEFFDYWSLLDPDDGESRLRETIVGQARTVAVFLEGKAT